jgi:hypothetical protein
MLTHRGSPIVLYWFVFRLVVGGVVMIVGVILPPPFGSCNDRDSSASVQSGFRKPEKSTQVRQNDDIATSGLVYSDF